jgi:hypothetical protein
MHAVVSGDELDKAGVGTFLDAAAFVVAPSSDLSMVRCRVSRLFEAPVKTL